MLLLTRKLNELIKIGDDITIKIAEINPHTVVVGIAAPKHIEVDRKEIWDAKHDKQKHEDN